MMNKGQVGRAWLLELKIQLTPTDSLGDIGFRPQHMPIATSCLQHILTGGNPSDTLTNRILYSLLHFNFLISHTLVRLLATFTI